MSLKIETIQLDDFRGYKHLLLDDLSDFVVIVGPNAVGKTNIIEAIQLLTAGISFRRPAWSEVISWNASHARISIQLEDEKRSIQHRAIFNDNERDYEVNGKKKSPSSIRGTLPCVLFTPDDLQLIKASSGHRRDAIDQLALQLSKNYTTLKKEYQQAHRQRNLLIKDGIHEGPLFESWDESFATHGARLSLTRQRLFERLFSHMQEIYEQIAPHEQLDALYIPSWKRIDENNRQIGDVAQYIEQDAEESTIKSVEDTLLAHSQQVRDQELQRGASIIGPHKDEIAFFINKRNARLFASQGQQRTIILTMKLASIELINDILGMKPVLLLDDVMSELDENHRDALTKFINKETQTFITTTNLDYFSPQVIEQATIVRVPIKGTRYEYGQD